MKIVILLVGILVISSPANATMYKCTDVDGSITFKDKPCESQAQEVLKEKSYTRPGTPASNSFDSSSSTLTPLEPIKRMSDGKKVSNSSPLARVYMKFLVSLKRCNRTEMSRYVSRKMVEGMKTTSDTEFRNGCRVLVDLLPKDFDDATELIEGDKGKIQWMSVESTTDSSGMTTKFTSEHTEKFVKEDGSWKYGD